ncbi:MULTISPECIES: TonB-dependent receptor [unclassified Parabacteroides]|uniref:SusC/RagA family TonB-linked outer membrane protein n=1 Tax=unclassified Parabacteroides TaxID=2649774 RepID=UPI002476A893|nr:MULTISPECIES: TonB-dependent receptor [unclassified Parabacteroides]
MGVQQQAIQLRGVVSDAYGELLVGVSIVEKGTTNGTVTNIDGEFSLSVRSASAQLEISYIGYTTQTLAVGNTRNFNVTLQESVTGLDEVVVVGYGTQKKATLTGSVSQVGGDELKKVAAANLTNTLAGKTAGVIANVRSGEPGEDNASILIRGKGTTGNTSPLIVVDGIADRSFSRLNPEDIESISILKDASAAIYGARAANGVILVTTKRGKEGKVNVNYSGSYTVSQPTRIPKMLNSLEYATYINEYDAGHGLSQTYSDEAIEKIKNGSDPINYGDINWWESVARDWAPRTQHSLSVSGGSDKVSFYTSFQYMWQDAIYRESAQDYGQYQFTANVDAKITKAIKFSLDVLGRQERRNRGIYETDYMFEYFLKTSPMVPAKYPNGLYRAGVDGITRNAAIMVTDLPGTDNNKSNILNLKPRLRIDLDVLTKGLYLEGYAAIDLSFNNGKTIYHPYDIYEYDATSGEYNTLRAQTGQISMNSWANNSDRITLNGRIGYSNTFGDHKIDAFAAYEQSTYNYNTVSAYRTNYLSTAIMEIFAGSDNPEDMSNGGYGDKTARQNFFGRVNYNYKDKYLAEVTMRYDGSMNFPKGNRWGLFPGFSAGWVLSEEDFFIPAKDYVNFLKLKGSWGMMGNDNVSAFQYLSRYGFISSNKGFKGSGVMFGDEVYKAIYQMVEANPNITWETAKTWNIGLQAQFLDNKFNFEFDVFKSKRENILRARNASIPSYAGLSLPSENIGKMDNKGFEIVAGYQDRAGDFNWGVNGNFTFAENKMVYIDEAESTPAWQRATGHPIDSYTLYDALGIYQTPEEVANSVHIEGAQPGDLIYRDTNDDGQITWDDAIRINASPTPKVIYGFTFNGGWKGLDLNVFFQGQAQARTLVQPSMNMITCFYDGRWTPLNTAEQNLEAKYPRAMIKQTYGDKFNGDGSTWWLRNAAFLRLKSVELGYTLPKNISQKVGVEYLRVYVNGNNLFTIDKIKDFDPELTKSITAYPLQRSFTAGLNITF